MSFYTSAHFYRPGFPPAVDTSGLTEFLRQLNACELLAGSRIESCEINFAPAISNEVPDFWLETANSMTRIPADFEYKGGSIEGAIDAIAEQNQTIGRLDISGVLSEDAWSLFDVEHPSGEPLNFFTNGWSMSMGPTVLSMLQWDEIGELQVGWASFAVHGQGYFFPWTFREWVDRFTGDPRIQAVCALCRAVWPVSPIRPDADLIDARRGYADWWPYDDAAAPLDWAWGPQEG